MDRSSGVVSEKLFNPRSFVCGEIIANDVVSLPLVDGMRYQQERQQTLRLCAGCGFASTLPALVLRAAYKENGPWQ